MKQRARIHYTESQKALMWERWQKGERTVTDNHASPNRGRTSADGDAREHC